MTPLPMIGSLVAFLSGFSEQTNPDMTSSRSSSDLVVSDARLRRATIIDQIGSDGTEEFFLSEYVGEYKEPDILNAFDDKFFDLSNSDDLLELNSRWLRSLPNLKVLTCEEMKGEVDRRAAALPDRPARAAQALQMGHVYEAYPCSLPGNWSRIMGSNGR